MKILVIIILIFYFVGIRKKKAKPSSGEAKSSGTAKTVTRTFQGIQKKRASAVPNRPRKVKRTSEEAEALERASLSKKACNYEAAYSKGRPDRIGRRGDYEPVVPGGMIRITCAYCGAENFIPMGTHDHYHCYFCWEKL